MRPIISLRQHAGRLTSSSGCRFASTKADGIRQNARATAAAKLAATLAGDEHGDTLALDPDSKKITTPVGDLPISPVMDPDWIEARQRFKQTKPKPVANPASKGRFRNKLAKNPYAQALATPWRKCGASGNGMPRFFLQDFKLIAHPKTKEPWWAPGDLDANPASDAVLDEIDAFIDETEAAIDETDDILADAETPASPPAKPGQKTKPQSPVGYLTSRSDMIAAVSPAGPKNKLNGQHIAMITSRTRLVRKGIIPKLVWRADMPEYLLEEMRRRIVDDLLYLAKLRAEDDRTHLVPVETWDDANKLPMRGCLLWQLGGGRTGASIPGPLATVDVEGASYERAMPVHNLEIMLGVEQLDRLRQEEIFAENPLIMVRKSRSIDVQLRLWKLQGYLAPAMTRLFE